MPSECCAESTINGLLQLTINIKLIHAVNVTFTEGYVNVTCNRFLLTKTGIFKSDYCAKEF